MCGCGYAGWTHKSRRKFVNSDDNNSGKADNRRQRQCALPVRRVGEVLPSSLCPPTSCHRQQRQQRQQRRPPRPTTRRVFSSQSPSTSPT
mmetsp:Transcript_5444/g.12587  ORF Transcript_5444/g.12587 Transcript_5444/m.12587 type:complete len:90 (+) Transcript_5444:97-366(+)